jgi:hypothetical protein
MKKLYTLCVAVVLTSLMSVNLLHAQTPTPIVVSDLHAYDITLNSQADLPSHPLSGQLVTFDAVVVSYPKNSGLANITNAGVPGRIHVFVTDVKAVEMGRDGMSIQIVVDGARRETLEALVRGDVISVVGNLTFFGNVSQFATTEVTQIGNVMIDEEYEGLEVLLEPTAVDLSEINIPSEVADRHRWNSDGYAKHNHRYVRLEGLEVIGRTENATGRPWLALTDGTSIIYTTDTSLRYRNDRGFGYAYNATTEQGLNYNWRRLSAELDGPYAPPPAGSIVDIQGYIVVNTFNPANLDETAAQSTFKIAPWDDGILWTQDGDDTEFRITEGINNDLVVLGFPATLDNIAVSPEMITSDSEVTVSVDVLLPEEDYVLNSVTITYTALGYNDETASEMTATMTASGNTYSYTFDSYDDFTVVNYQITANTSTPGGIQTNARASGTFSVANADVTSPPMFSPGSGSYENAVAVTLTSATEGASIYYTIDGSDPTVDSDMYDGPVNLTETATLKAIAKADGLDASPIASRMYTVTVAATPAATLAALRAGSQDGTVYQYTGDAVVTFTRSARNAKFIMDETGGMLIDDAPGVITSPYTAGDVITDVFGTLGNFNQLVQFAPQADPGAPTATADINPMVITLSELDITSHESALVQINNVRFVPRVTSTGENPVPANFPTNAQDLAVTDNSLDGGQVIFRTAFTEADYMGQAVPDAPINLTAIVGNFRGTIQLTARSTADFNFDVSAERLDGADEFRLSQNYPNPFNPSTSISYSVAEVVNVNLVVYDILGRVVATLINDVHTPGLYNVNFDASRLASGTYIYRLEAGDFVSTKKMMLIK